MTFKSDNLKKKILLNAIGIAVFDGWSSKTLLEASLLSGVKSTDTKKLFPRGGLDLARYYHEYEDNVFLDSLRKIDFNNLSQFEKIELALFKRFEIISVNKEAFRRSMSLFALPFHQIEGLNLVFSTCDLIWVEIGDKSLEYDWYTKRIILVSIYLSSLLYLFGDDSSNNEHTFQYISRRLKEIKKLGKIKIDISDLFSYFNNKILNNIQN